AATGRGYDGADGAGRVGNTGSRKRTDPAGPKLAGKFVGSTFSVNVRPWLLFQTANVLASSRIVLMAYPARIALCLPKIQPAIPSFFGICQARPSDGENWLFRIA